MLLDRLLLLLLPHGNDEGQVHIVELGALKVIERVHEDLAHAVVLCALEQGPSRIYKLGVEVSGEGLARVVGQYPHQHNGVVLP